MSVSVSPERLYVPRQECPHEDLIVSTCKLERVGLSLFPVPLRSLRPWASPALCELTFPDLGSGSIPADPSPLTSPLLPPQSLDFESQPVHTVVLEALNKFLDPRFADLGTFRDQAIVRVAVTDVDEPPEFRPPSGLLEVQEDAQVGSLVGVVTARDPDAANRPVR